MTLQVKDPARSARVVALFGGLDVISGLVIAGLGGAGVFPGNEITAIAGGLLISVVGIGLIMWSRRIAEQTPSSGGGN